MKRFVYNWREWGFKLAWSMLTNPKLWEPVPATEVRNCDCDHCAYGAYIKELEIIKLLEAEEERLYAIDKNDETLFMYGKAIALIKREK